MLGDLQPRRIALGRRAPVTRSIIVQILRPLFGTRNDRGTDLYFPVDNFSDPSLAFLRLQVGLQDGAQNRGVSCKPCCFACWAGWRPTSLS